MASIVRHVFAEKTLARQTEAAIYLTSPVNDRTPVRNRLVDTMLEDDLIWPFGNERDLNRCPA